MAEETKKNKPVKTVKTDKNGKEKISLGAKIKKFIRDYRSELKKIVWPVDENEKGIRRFKKVFDMTGVVIISIAFIAVIVGLLDLAFGTGVITLLGKIRELIKV